MRVGRRIFGTLGIRSGEGPRVGWLVIHSLFIGVFCAFFLTAANALFLDRFEITFLPMAYIAAALVGYLAMLLFSRLEKSVPVSWLLAINLGALAAISALFWYLTRTTGNDWVVFFMFVAVGPMFNLIFLGYWGLTVRLFDLRQGKRLFGLVGAGEEVSTIIGLFSIPFLLRFLQGPEPLLLIATAGLVGCLLVVVVMSRIYRDQLTDATGDADAEGEKAEGIQPRKTGAGALLGNPYFLLMAGLVILLSLAHYIVDFSFLSQIRVKFEGPEQIARFLGLFFGITKILELVMKVFVSGRLVNQFGLRVGLLVLPVLLTACAGFAVAIGSFGLGAAHFFVLVALSKLIWVVARTSTFLPSFRVLYQPLPRVERFSYQTHVDGTSKQLAIGLVGVGLLLSSNSPSFNALNLFYALLPILALWIVAVIMIHGRYRDRLMENISEDAGDESQRSTVDALIEELRKLDTGYLENSVALLARVDATAVMPMLTRMVAAEDRQTQLAALRYIKQLKGLAALDAVTSCAATEADAEVRAQAEGTAATLKEVLALAKDPARVAELASSPLPAQRDLAVSAIGFAPDPKAHVSLSDLLWDKDRDVRRASLVAAGRTGDPAYRQRIISQLFSPRFANAATFALITIGEPGLGEIERVFNRAEPTLQARILRIYQRIVHPNTQRLLLAKLSSPSREVRGAALRSLSATGFTADEEQTATVVNEIENVISTLAWNVASLMDLRDAKEADELRDALEAEIEGGRDALFLLLSLLSDRSAISLVQDILDSGRPEATVYALEIMDLLISPELKPLVFPVLEDLPYPQLLRRLDTPTARQRLGQLERLSAIINREHDKIGLWTRTCAVQAMGRTATEVLPDLIASLYHPRPLVQEAAVLAIVNIDHDAYSPLRRKLPEETLSRLDAVVGDSQADDQEQETRTVLGRMQVLNKALGFIGLPAEAMVVLAETSIERNLKPGHRLLSAKDSQDCIFLLVDGEMFLVGEGGPDPARPVPPLCLVAFGHKTDPVEAVQPSRLVQVDPGFLHELAAEHFDLIPVLIKSARQIFEQPVEKQTRAMGEETRAEAFEHGLQV